MDSLLLLASNILLILGLEANACSRMWFSKMSDNTYQPNYVRGIVLSEWLVASDVFVFNVASSLYTFDVIWAKSDIDATLANGAALRTFDLSWGVFDNAGISDHNLIEVVISYRSNVVRETVPPR